MQGRTSVSVQGEGRSEVNPVQERGRTAVNPRDPGSLVWIVVREQVFLQTGQVFALLAAHGTTMVLEFKRYLLDSGKILSEQSSGKFTFLVVYFKLKFSHLL